LKLYDKDEIEQEFIKIGIRGLTNLNTMPRLDIDRAEATTIVTTMGIEWIPWIPRYPWNVTCFHGMESIPSIENTGFSPW
jgi:hypothetical protein